MRIPTIDQPYVSLAAWVCRLALYAGPETTDLVCNDTGLVVYMTPTAWRHVHQWPGGHRNVSSAVSVPHKQAQTAAIDRAFAWAKRWKLPIVKVDLVQIVSVGEVVSGNRIWYGEAWREVLSNACCFGSALVRFAEGSQFTSATATVHLKPKEWL